MNFDDAFVRLLGHEGGYSNHPADKGGETNWGITQAVARENGYTGAMIDMRVDQAKAIYLVKYWARVQAEILPSELRYSVFDAAVNSGVSQAVKWLQRAAGAEDDGILGPQTLTAVKNQPGYITAAKFNGQRLEFMCGLSNFGSFGKGWVRRVAAILKG